MNRVPVVVDASVMVKWIRSEAEDLLAQADKLLSHVQDGKVELYAPQLAKYEVGNVLVKRKLALEPAYISLSTYYSLPVNFVVETKQTAENTYQMAAELGITYYDAAYLSLAQTLSAPLVTENIKHLEKTAKVKVIPLAEY